MAFEIRFQWWSINNNLTHHVSVIREFISKPQLWMDAKINSFLQNVVLEHTMHHMYYMFLREICFFLSPNGVLSFQCYSTSIVHVIDVYPISLLTTFIVKLIWSFFLQHEKCTLYSMAVSDAWSLKCDWCNIRRVERLQYSDIHSIACLCVVFILSTVLYTNLLP